MKKFWAILVACALMLPCAAAFADGDAGEVVVYNWGEYIDEDVLDMFTEETGIKVTYAMFSTNEDMYVKLKAGAANYDVIFPSDYMIERLLNEDRLEKLNYDNIPNAANILSWLREDPYNVYDPTNEYSVPYMWGTVGILYNTEMVDEPITSWTSMFDTKYVNNVFMYDSFRDSIGITLKMLGYSMNTRDWDQINEAKEALIKQKQDGIVKAYQVDETKDKMVAGEAALALIWSGDAQYAIELNDKLEYVVPEEGSNIWIDGMCIPKGAQNKENAEAFINFLCREDIARMNMDEIGYCTPIQPVVDNMTDEEKANHVWNPTADEIARCEIFRDVGDAVMDYEDVWLEIKAAR